MGIVGNDPGKENARNDLGKENAGDNDTCMENDGNDAGGKAGYEGPISVGNVIFGHDMIPDNVGSDPISEDKLHTM